MPEQQQSIVDIYEGEVSPESGTRQVTPSPAAAPGRGPDGRFVSQEQPSIKKHSILAIRAAKELGLSDDEIGQASPDELRDFIRDSQLTRTIQTQSQVFDNAVSRLQQAPVQPAAQPEEPQLGFETEHLDQGIVRFMREQTKLVGDLRREIAELRQGQQAQIQETIGQRADRIFEKHAQVYGKGRGYELDRQGRDYARRMAALSYANATGATYDNLEQVLEKATTLLFGQQKPQPQPQKAADDWSQAGLAVPSLRGQDEPQLEGRERAIAGVRAYQAAVNGTHHGEPPELANEFLK